MILQWWHELPGPNDSLLSSDSKIVMYNIKGHGCIYIYIYVPRKLPAEVLVSISVNFIKKDFVNKFHGKTE